MTVKRLADINCYDGKTINPLRFPDETYELYSVPSFDVGYPEIIRGSDIGSSKLVVEENDVLICKINPRINRVWVVKHNTKFPLLASSEWIVVRNRDIDSNYLKWYFSSPAFRNLLVSQVAGIGGSLTRAQPKQVGIYPIPIVSLNEQLKIADTLEIVTELISLRIKQLTKLDELVKARFIEMFGDPVKNEKNWPMARLSDIAMIRIGPFGSLLHREDYIENGHALVNPSHVIDGAIVADKTLTVSEDKYRELSAYKLEIGDVVLGRRGEMGRCAVVYNDGFICGTGSLIIRSGNTIKPYFLQKILSYPTFKSVIEEKSVGVTMQNLNVPIVSSLLIPSLPLELQEQYLKFVKQVDKLKFEIQKNLDILETFRKALMKQYFTEVKI